MPVSEEMKEHLSGANGSTHLGVFLKITAKDGTVLRVWNGTRNKKLNGETYQAYPVAPSQLQTANGLKADNLEVTAIYSGLFNAVTLRARKWMGARVEYAVYDYKNFALGYAERRTGFIAETEIGKYSAKPELLSLSNKLGVPSGFTYQEDCNVVKFGDTRCGVDLNGWTRNGYKIKTAATVAAPILNRQQFSVEFSEIFARGLRGRYYSDGSFGTLALERLDEKIDFTYGTNAPAAEVPLDNFSVRWEGFVTAPFTETFTFSVEHDDGAKVWVNGDLIIDQWTTLGTHTGTKAMTAGVPVSIKVEYRDETGFAKIKLSWSSASQALQIIPPTALAPPLGAIPANSLYERGMIRFLSGPNQGLETQILTNSGNALTLFLPLFYTPLVGDELELITGCNRKINICRDLYGNAYRNRSFFMLPGRNKLTLPER